MISTQEPNGSIIMPIIYRYIHSTHAARIRNAIHSCRPYQLGPQPSDLSLGWPPAPLSAPVHQRYVVSVTLLYMHALLLYKHKTIRFC